MRPQQPRRVVDVCVNGLSVRLGASASNLSAVIDGVGVCGATEAADVDGNAVWERGIIIDVGALAHLRKHSEAFSINNRRHVAGFAEDAPGFNEQAFLWRGGANAIALGVLATGGTSDALALNDLDQVVGQASSPAAAGSPFKFVEHAFLWDRGVMVDLNTALPSGTVGVLTSARGINDRG